MTLLAADLDNTLIHSRKRDGDVCVERIAGKENCFMSPKAYERLQRLDICVTPLTARSIMQYQRIHLFRKAGTRYAICSMGGVLLKDDEIDTQWRAETKAVVREQRFAMDELFSLLLADDRVPLVKWVDGVFIFAKSKSALSIAQRAPRGQLSLIGCGEKLYILPAAINKGFALQKLKKLVRPEKTICAGDSVLDIPMLNLADIAIVPNETLAAQVSAKQVIVLPAGANFAEFILELA
jgi:hydroxymethylpyrimidine pyrophosphatase-like HAD family hydrolase